MGGEVIEKEKMKKKKKTNKEIWDEEHKFQKYFRKNYRKLLKKEPSFLEFEYSLKDAHWYLTEGANPFIRELREKYSNKRIVARVDVIWGDGNKIYVGEIKYQNPTKHKDFLDALKVLGYTAYLKWVSPNLKGKLVPTILMPLKRIHYEELIIARMLKVELFGIKKEKQEYEIINTKKIPDHYWLYKKNIK